MDDAFGNALMVEMEDFLAEGEILEQARPACAGAKRIIIVGAPRTDILGWRSRRTGSFISGLLMPFLALASVVNWRRLVVSPLLVPTFIVPGVFNLMHVV